MWREGVRDTFSQCISALREVVLGGRTRRKGEWVLGAFLVLINTRRYQHHGMGLFTPAISMASQIRSPSFPALRLYENSGFGGWGWWHENIYSFDYWLFSIPINLPSRQPVNSRHLPTLIRIYARATTVLIYSMYPAHPPFRRQERKI